ncbi:MAG: T9SS C-terminal target domain-containing protein [Cytophagales bacterium]|nr:MAG: T9SS C-terminal target domain-containing protein [Cytophagales bacterium]
MIFKFKLFILFLLTNNFVYCQTITEKYWNYRNFFNDNFILRGFGNDFMGGYSLPVSDIKSMPHYNESGEINTKFIEGFGNINLGGFPNVTFGDCTIQLGYYIGVLGIEFRLLREAGENTEDLEQEIYEALTALERLDKNSDRFVGKVDGGVNWIEPHWAHVSDGMLLRDDVRDDFLGIFFDQKKIAQRYYPQITKPESIQSLKSLFISNSRSDCKGDFSATLAGSVGGTYKKGGGNLLSPDQIAYLFLGLTIMKKYSFNTTVTAKNSEGTTVSYNTWQWCQQIITRIIKNIDKNNFTLKNGFGIPVGAEPNIEMHKYPIQRIQVQWGDNTALINSGGNIISGGFYDIFPNSLVNADRTCDYARENHFDYAPEILWGIDVGNDFAAGYSGMYYAMSNYNGVNTYKELNDYFGSFESYLQPLVNAALFERDASNISTYINRQLENAPCDGMQCRIKHNEDRGKYLWNSSEKANKYIRNFYDANVTKSKRHLNGLEYMLLHNLYLLKTGQTMKKLQTKSAGEGDLNNTGQDILTANKRVSSTINQNSTVKYIAGDLVILDEGFDSNSKKIEAFTEETANENPCVESAKFGAYCPDVNIKSQGNLMPPFFEIQGDELIKYYTGSVGASPTRRYTFVSNKVNSGTVSEEKYVEEPHWYMYPNPGGRAAGSRWDMGGGYIQDVKAVKSWYWGNLKKEESFDYTLQVVMKYYGVDRVVASRSVRMKHFRCIISCTRLETDSLVEENNLKKEIQKVQAFPNPTNSFITLDFGFKDNHEIEIFNSTGSLIDKKNVDKEQLEIDLSHYLDGIYIVKVKNSIGIQVIKVTVTH